MKTGAGIVSADWLAAFAPKKEENSGDPQPKQSGWPEVKFKEPEV